MSDIDLEAEEFAFSKPPFDAVRQALASAADSADAVVPSTIVYGLSDLTPGELRLITPVWSELATTLKRRILRALHEASEAMFELSYREIALLALGDVSSTVRALAIDLLWTDESPDIMRQLMQIAQQDSDELVRSSALKGLGRFILLGEYGDIPGEVAEEAQALAMNLHTNAAEPLEVKRRALETLSNSSHPELNALIRSAYDNGNHDLKISAIYAMGRSCNKVWQDILLNELDSSDNESVYEAIGACGQLQLSDSVQQISELALSEDRDLQTMAISALGEIGGKHAFELLTALQETTSDEELVGIIDDALDVAGFSLSFASLDFDLEID